MDNDLSEQLKNVYIKADMPLCTNGAHSSNGARHCIITICRKKDGYELEELQDYSGVLNPDQPVISRQHAFMYII